MKKMYYYCYSYVRVRVSVCTSVYYFFNELIVQIHIDAIREPL